MTGLIELRAGSLTMRFCPQLAFLRHVCWNGTNGAQIEIVRGIFPAIRNSDWDTIPFEITGLEIEPQSESFLVRYRAHCCSFPFDWTGELSGSTDGTIAYRFSGQATGELLKNRIGLCVLHPIEPCTGKPCRVRHADGSRTEGKFPHLISPHQPFKDVAQVSHDVTGDIEATVNFAGEVFEMEDQRNWTDASYKTYSTPLELPFPVAMHRGEPVDHVITITTLGDDQHVNQAGFRSPTERAASVIVDWVRAVDRPPIGLSMAKFESEIGYDVTSELAKLQLDHLRVDVDLSLSAWAADADAALQLADDAVLQLEFALFIDEDHEHVLSECVDWLSLRASRIARVLVYHRKEKVTPDSLIAAMESNRARASLPMPIGYGTNAYFAELNRNRPSLRKDSLVCYSVNPQVHAFDELSLCETFEGQTETAKSAGEIFGKPVVVSPITLRPRFNPNATSDAAGQDSLEPESDPRQSTRFAAAWTVGSLASLATNRHVSALTYFETSGPRGIMDAGGRNYPVFDIFAAVATARQCVPTRVARPLDFAAVGLVGHQGERQVLIANLTGHEQTVELETGSGTTSTRTVAPHETQLVECEV